MDALCDVGAGLTVCAEGGKCWVYGSISQQLLASARKEFYGDQESLSQESLALFSAVERCVSSPGDNVDGLFDILDQASCSAYTGSVWLRTVHF